MTRRAPIVAFYFSVLVLSASLAISVASAAGFTPPSNPRANLSPAPKYTFVSGSSQRYGVGSPPPSCWKLGATGSLVAQPSAPKCVADELAATNRAHRAEGVAAIVLPSNFERLSAPEQLLVLVDVERVSRGEAPVVGLSSKANVFARQGALKNADPELPSSASGVVGATGAWASNYAGALNTLDANYDWMYLDGWQGNSTMNYDCTGPNATGCWGHRDNILANASNMACYGSSCSLVMGAGFVPNGSGRGYATYTELLVQIAGATPALYYTWDMAVAAGATG